MSAPSQKQVALAIKMAGALGEPLPRAARADSASLSAWISAREARYKSAASKSSALPKGAFSKRRRPGFGSGGSRAAAAGRSGLSGSVAEALYAKHMEKRT